MAAKKKTKPATGGPAPLASLPTLPKSPPPLQATATPRVLPATGSVSSIVRRALRGQAEHALKFGWTFSQYQDHIAQDTSLDLHGGATEEACAEVWGATLAAWHEAISGYDPLLAREGMRRRLLEMAEKELDPIARIGAEKLLAQIQPGVMPVKVVQAEGGNVPNVVANVLVQLSEQKLAQIMDDYERALPAKRGA
jgi:hypothetical protein